jgi:hypothetical protein
MPHGRDDGRSLVSRLMLDGLPSDQTGVAALGQGLDHLGGQQHRMVLLDCTVRVLEHRQRGVEVPQLTLCLHHRQGTVMRYLALPCRSQRATSAGSNSGSA